MRLLLSTVPGFCIVILLLAYFKPTIVQSGYKYVSRRDLVLITTANIVFSTFCLIFLVGALQ